MKKHHCPGEEWDKELNVYFAVFSYIITETRQTKITIKKFTFEV